MEDERALTEEEGQVAPEPAPPPAQAPPAVVILAALGLAVLLAALVETVLPRVTWTTLVLTTAIPLSLVFILLWRTGRLSPPEESRREANEEPPDRDEAAGDDPGDT